MIKIIVCLKQALYLYSRTGIDSKGQVHPEAAAYVPNPYDEVALEEALRIKDRLEQVEVSVLGIGPERIETVLRYGLAMGADRAIHINSGTSISVDSWVKSRILEAAVNAQGYDLILFGKKSIDHSSGVLGGFVAKLLDLPYVYAATEIDLAFKQRRVKLYQVLTNGGRQRIECKLPAVLSVETGSVKPRYPSLKGRLGANQKELIRLDTLQPDHAGFQHPEPLTRILNFSISRPKPKKIFTPDSSLPAEERIKSILSGGLVEKKSHFQKGSSGELARQLIKFLQENRIIKDSIKKT
jgi:electron transfer flavoprotein beta subunit